MLLCFTIQVTVFKLTARTISFQLRKKSVTATLSTLMLLSRTSQMQRN